MLKDLTISILAAIAVVTAGAAFLKGVTLVSDALKLTPSEQTLFAQLAFYLLLLSGKLILDRL